MSVDSPETSVPNVDNLKTDILSEAEVQALLTEEDYGLTRPELTRFATYEDWEERRSTSSHNRGWFENLPQQGEPDSGIYKAYRAYPSFQRMLVVRPSLVTTIAAQREADEQAGVKPSQVSEATDRLLYEAYELMADLTDIHDGEAVLNPSGSVPEGQIDPNCLMI